MESGEHRMSSWNYRMTKRVVDGQPVFEVREVYYDDGGRINGWTKDPATLAGDTKMELMGVVSRMSSCIGAAVVDIDEPTDYAKETSG
jgi:hypothetical protein